MELVDENTVLEVGKFYNVRCAAMGDRYGNNFRYYLPIIGEPHIDRQFGLSDKHYHVDGRFCSDNNLYITIKKGFTNAVCSIGLSNSIYTVKDIVIKKLKCRQLTTGLNPPIVKLFQPNEDSSWVKWYKTMIGKSCKGKQCPHLGTKMLEQDGHLICPLHNLKGSLQTEKIIY